MQGKKCVSKMFILDRWTHNPFKEIYLKKESALYYLFVLNYYLYDDREKEQN